MKAQQQGGNWIMNDAYSISRGLDTSIVQNYLYEVLIGKQWFECQVKVNESGMWVVELVEYPMRGYVLILTEQLEFRYFDGGR